MTDENKTLGIIGIDAEGKVTVREPVFVSLSSYKNSRYLDLRKFYEKDGKWLPGSKGVTFHAGQFTEHLRILNENREEILTWTAEKK